MAIAIRILYKQKTAYTQSIISRVCERFHNLVALNEMKFTNQITLKSR